MEVILKACNITKRYGEEVLKGISLEIEKGSFTALLGPSGSGKSTLLNILSGQLKPSGGTVECGQRIITELSEKQLAGWKRSSIGNIFQSYMLLNNLTVEENVRIGVCPGRPPLNFDRLARLLEIDGLLSRFPSQLSGGQQQRAAIARAVIKGPELLFCDEATGALDEENSKKVVGLLNELRSVYGVTILFATHNRQIARTAGRVLTIKDGCLFDDVTNHNPISANEMVWG